MPYTDEQIIELAAIKVQEVVVPKVETFTDNVTKEVHSMHLEMKGNREFDATVIAQLNDVRHRVEKFDGVCKLVAELHTLFCKNGYMARFNALADAVQVFFRDRLATCPIASDVQAIERDMESRRVEALDRADGHERRMTGQLVAGGSLR
jgi:hypothetical protein